ncbi:MAG: type II secretion system GspH family protein [Armatimonadetes bacterium]|nr:type II secretion system GspH family protein [Armatimonadota bacterium]
MKIRAFTAIEILLVITIIVMLSAILFPVFNRAKVDAFRSAGISNMAQIGKSTLLYQADHDDRYPVAIDSALIPGVYQRSFSTDEVEVYGPMISTAPALTALLKPYGATAMVWRNKLDQGGTVNYSLADGTTAAIRSSSFADEYGTSVAYRAELGLRKLSSSSISTSDVGLIVDMLPWYGGVNSKNVDIKASNMLFADGHVKPVNLAGRVRYWLRSF